MLCLQAAAACRLHAAQTKWFCLNLGCQLAAGIRNRFEALGASRPPKSIKLKAGGKRLEVRFIDGQLVQLSSEYLRVMSPSADTRDRRDAQGKTRVVAGRRHVGIRAIEPVGSYAVRLKFDDLHHAGIYSWDLLRDLGVNKWANMRKYIQQLRSRGLSRDPPVTRAATAKPRGHQH